MKAAGCRNRSGTRARISGPTRCPRVARHRIELARNVEVEERAEPRIVPDQAQNIGRAAQWHSVSSRATKRVTPAPWTRARLSKKSFGPEQGDEFVAVALLDRALDDDDTGFRRGALGDDRLAGPEIADVERAAERLDLLGRQAVERRVGGIEKA